APARAPDRGPRPADSVPPAQQAATAAPGGGVSATPNGNGEFAGARRSNGPPGTAGNGSHNGNGNGNGKANRYGRPAPPPPLPEGDRPLRLLRITLNETDDEAADRRRLNELVQTLRSLPGPDEVRLVL